MELRQLEYFVAVAEESNFTRAAHRLHIAQPGVSAQIRRLERELGQPLLDRSRRTVRLTAAGAAVLPHARTALSAVAAARSAVDDLTGLLRGVVSIGTVTSHSVDLPALLAEFHTEHPKVEVTLGIDSSDALMDNARSGRLDAAIVSIGPDEQPEGLEIHLITEEFIDAAVARSDDLANRDRIPLAELADRPVITLPRGAGIRRRFDQACAHAGVAPRIAFEAATPQAVADLAERGLGVAIVPRSVAHGRDTLHAAALVPEVRGRLVWAWRSGDALSPAARVLVQKARLLRRVRPDA
ncbi:LysR family transcriptional regulator [Mycolicibacterium thermoresistibile]